MCVCAATYQRMELEKKKARVKKCSQTGPVIRYHSVTMPLIEQLPVETEINVVGETPGSASSVVAIATACRYV